MNRFTVILPLPPSVNSMFVNNPRGGRWSSKKYKEWQDACREPLQGFWPELHEPGDLWWRWRFTLYGLSKVADLSNYLKAAEDMIVTMTGLKDNQVRSLHAYREDEHSAWGKCIEMEVEILG